MFIKHQGFQTILRVDKKYTSTFNETLYATVIHSNYSIFQ